MKIKNKTDDWDKPDDRDLARASERACVRAGEGRVREWVGESEALNLKNYLVFRRAFESL